MRRLIEDRRPLAEQQEFFEIFVYPGATLFCAAVQNAASSGFYKAVSALTSSFLEIEKAAFELTGTT
jgi:TorA maturation chaperone TorD